MEYKLVVHQELEIAADLLLGSANYTIGRDSACDVVLLDPYVSRIHATLILMPAQTNKPPYYVIKDGGWNDAKSRNGVWVNGSQIDEIRELKHQDMITFSAKHLYPQIIFYNEFLAQVDEKSTIPSNFREK